MEAYLSKYQASKSFKEKQENLSSVIQKENEFRHLFAQDRLNPLLNDPNLLMIPIHQQKEDCLKYAELFPEEKALAKAMALEKNRKAAGLPAIVSQKEFERNLDLFTEGALRFLNWNNVFCAGGSILAALSPIPEKYSARNKERRQYYHDKAYPASDVDLFLYGLNEEEAKAKLTEIYQAICDAIPYEVIAFRSKHAVTLVSQYPHRHIQIVLRLYKSPAEVLMGFDVDCCSVGYDGKNVWMMPRAHNAIVSQYNTIDISRRSPSYEVRLAKYSERGFEVLVPSLLREKIDPQVYEKSFDKVQGLARLLQIERLRNSEARIQFRERQRVKKMAGSVKRETFWNKVTDLIGNLAQEDGTMIVAGPNASDYSTVFLPWGPGHTAAETQRTMDTKDRVLNSYWIKTQQGRTHHLHPCFMGNLPTILNDCCGGCPPLPADYDPESPYVSGALTFIVDDPGRQSIGSFHPITEGEWTDGAYLPESQEKLCLAVVNNQVEIVKQILGSKTDPSGQDGLGRTPLHLGAMSGSVESCKLLIDAGARITARMSDGRTPLHICCEYGRTEIAELILNRSKENEKKMNAELKNPAGAKGAKGNTKITKQKKAPRRRDDSDDDYDYDEEEEDYSDDYDEGGSEASQEVVAAPKVDDPNAPEMKHDVIDLEKTDWDLFAPLHFAILYGRKECVSLLLNHSAKADHSLILENGNMFSTLALATFHSDEDVACEIAEMLMEGGAKASTTNHQGDTALHSAISNSREKFVAKLLQVDPSAKSSINHLNKGKKSPLSLAAANGLVATASLLLKNGAKVKIDEEDFKVWLIVASKWMQAYRLRQISPAKEAEDAIQPIEEAIEGKHFEMLELLVQAGADVKKSKNGMTLLDTIEEKIKAIETEKQNRYNRKVAQELAKKNEKEKKEQRKKDLEEVEKRASQEERGLTFEEFLSGNTEKKKEQELLSSLDDLLKKEDEEANLQKLNRIRKLLVEQGVHNSAWLNRTTYMPLPHPKIKSERLPNGAAYEKLFEAAWNGDVAKLEELTIKAPKGTKPLIVCVINFQNHTPLSVAAMRNHPHFVKKVLEIAEKQYVPYVDKKKEGKAEDVKINNLDLVKGVEKMGSNQLLAQISSTIGKIEELSLDDLQGTSAAAVMKSEAFSFSSAADLLRVTTSIHYILLGSKKSRVPHYLPMNALWIGALNGFVEVVETIFLSIKGLSHGLGKKDFEGAIYNEEELRYLLTQSLFNVTSTPLLSFILGLGEIPIARLLLRYAAGGFHFSYLRPSKAGDGQDQGEEEESDDEKEKEKKEKMEKKEKEKEKEGEEAEEEEMEQDRVLTTLKKGGYKGLAMEGKQDWGVGETPFGFRLNTWERFPIHYAAFHGNLQSLEFILSGEAGKELDEWKQKWAFKFDKNLHFLNKYAGGDLTKVKERMFGIASLDLQGRRNVFHYAANNNKAEAIRYLGEKGKNELPKLLNQKTKTKLTPLYYATMEDKKESVKALLSLKPNLFICDSKGWTAFHLCVARCDEKMLKIYLNSIEKDDLTKLMKNEGVKTSFSPFMLALSNNIKVAKILLEKHKDQIDLYQTNNNKDSFFHTAAKSSVVSMVQSLVDITQDSDENWINRENASGLTPLDISMKSFRLNLGKEVKSGKTLPLGSSEKKAFKKGSSKEKEKEKEEEERELNRKSTWETYEILRKCSEEKERREREKGRRGKGREISSSADVFKSFETENEENVSLAKEYFSGLMAMMKTKEEEEEEKEKEEEEEEEESEDEGEERSSSSFLPPKGLGEY